MTRQEIITHLDAWNNAKYSADARDELRKSVGWRQGMHTSFGTRLVELIETNGLRTIVTSATNHNPQPKIIDLVEDMVFDRIMVHKVAAALLAAGWDFTDPGGFMNKDPEEVQDFLEGCSTEISKWSEMYPSRRNLFKMICDAYLRNIRSYNR